MLKPKCVFFFTKFELDLWLGCVFLKKTEIYHFNYEICMFEQSPTHLPVFIVRELDEVPLDVLVAVLLLLHLEHKLIELLL